MHLTSTEIKFMNLLWKHEPILSGTLVKMCNEEFGWKKSTTYTFIKRLEERNAVVNNNAMVSSLISKNEVLQQESIDVINTVFDGSLVNFVSSYLTNRKLSNKEIEELKNLLNKQNIEEKKYVKFDV